MRSLRCSSDPGARPVSAPSLTPGSGANHDSSSRIPAPARTAARRMTPGRVMSMLMLIAACSSPAPAPDTAPDTGLDAVPPSAPHTPAAPLPPDTGAADTAPPSPADSQDTFFEGSEHVWLDAQERGVTFRAVGQEPGWVVEISGDRRMRIVTDYGARELDVTPVPAPTVDSTTWTTTYRARADGSDLRVLIRDEPCADTMSGERFSATVTLVLDDATYRGCGRALDGLF
jgi:uncharacterized membrane protein